MQLGIDRISRADHLLKGRRIGLIVNSASLDSRYRLTVEKIASRYRLAALFGPEHGVSGDLLAGEKVRSGLNARYGVPEFSLYGDALAPTAEQLALIDVLVYDLQDVGLRSYTFHSTLFNSMKACAANRIPVVVLDRPNPLGGVVVDGLVPQARFASFVSALPVPYRHGLTSGEFARMGQALGAPTCELTVVECQGWRRERDFRRWGRPWIGPSPARPSLGSLVAYATNFLLQAVNVSVGRGTALPFECFGAPYLEAERLAGALNALRLPGIRFLPHYFTPLTSTHRGTRCCGVRLVVTDMRRYSPFRTGVRIFDVLRQMYRHEFQICSPDYFDALAGTDVLRSGAWDAETFLQQSEESARAFTARVLPEYRLYCSGGLTSHDERREKS